MPLQRIASLESQLGTIHAALGQILREVASNGTSTSGLHVKVDIIAQSFKRLADDRMADRFDIDRHGRRIASLEHQLSLVSAAPAVPDWHPDPREITGTHQFAVIKAQHDELVARVKAEEARQRESGIWWKHQRAVWAAAIIGAVFLVLFTGAVTYAFAHLPK